MYDFPKIQDNLRDLTIKINSTHKLELIIVKDGLLNSIVHLEIPSFIEFDFSKFIFTINPIKKSHIGLFYVTGTL